MKKYLIILFSIIITTLFQSCEKVTEGLSRVTYYPVMELQGDMFMTIAQGSAFTDPGVTSEVGGQPVNVVITGDAVDSNTPGVYTIHYTSTNTDGFSASLSRWVGVIAASAAGNDFSGIYVRNINTQKFTWTKVTTGLYICNNVGGVAGNPPFIFDIHVFNTDGNNVIVPFQPSALGGNLYCSPTGGGAIGKIVYSPGAPGTLAYKWAVMGSGNFGTTLRTFNHSN